MGYIYVLLQKDKKRCKVGKTYNILSRIKSLEVEWGKFDMDSLIFKFKTNEKDFITLSKIENYIHTILFFNEWHINNKEQIQGFTETFKYLNKNIIVKDFILKYLKSKSENMYTLLDFDLIKENNVKLKEEVFLTKDNFYKELSLIKYKYKYKNKICCFLDLEYKFLEIKKLKQNNTYFSFDKENKSIKWYSNKEDTIKLIGSFLNFKTIIYTIDTFSKNKTCESNNKLFENISYIRCNLKQESKYLSPDFIYFSKKYLFEVILNEISLIFNNVNEIHEFKEKEIINLKSFNTLLYKNNNLINISNNLSFQQLKLFNFIYLLIQNNINNITDYKFKIDFLYIYENINKNATKSNYKYLSQININSLEKEFFINGNKIKLFKKLNIVLENKSKYITGEISFDFWNIIAKDKKKYSLDLYFMNNNLNSSFYYKLYEFLILNDINNNSKEISLFEFNNLFVQKDKPLKNISKVNEKLSRGINSINNFLNNSKYEVSYKKDKTIKFSFKKL